MKPCPFCGGEPRHERLVNIWIACSNCAGSTGHFNTLGEAEAAWSRRWPSPAKVDALRVVAWLAGVYLTEGDEHSRAALAKAVTAFRETPNG